MQLLPSTLANASSFCTTENSQPVQRHPRAIEIATRWRVAERLTYIDASLLGDRCQGVISV